MTDFSTYKAGDKIKLQIKVSIIEDYPHCSCCPTESTSKEIIVELKILHIIKRDDDFILIFERSGVFDEYNFRHECHDSTVNTFINSFILDTVDMVYGYIIVIDVDYQARLNMEAVDKFRKIIVDKSQGIERYKTEYAQLDKQMIALHDFPESPAFRLILNRMTDINIQINNNKAAINKANLELEKYAR